MTLPPPRPARSTPTWRTWSCGTSGQAPMRGRSSRRSGMPWRRSWVRIPRWLGGHSRQAERRPDLLTVARAALVGDEADVEEVMRVRERDRQRRAREAEEQARVDVARERREAAARWIA